MHRQYLSRFELKPGTWVFVPSDESRAFGAELVKRIRRRWHAPAFIFSLQSGGHVAAARLHASSTAIVRLDIERFFDRVTRTKVARALRAIGLSAGEAFEAARLSTVEKPTEPGFSVPFGYVQSPLLASLVLDRAQLGRELRAVRHEGAKLSVYVDDILLSGSDEAQVNGFVNRLVGAAEESNLPLNLEKSQLRAAEAAEAFNLRIGNSALKVNGLRMTRFRTDAFSATAAQLEGYARYLHSVNEEQAFAFLDDLERAGLEVS